MQNILDPNEFFDWVRAQPDDKEIVMENENTGCGCLLVQYGRYKQLEFKRVGFDAIEGIGFTGKRDIIHHLVLHSIDRNITSFKQAKEILAQLQ